MISLYMSNYSKYTTGGGLNPFWVEEQCAERSMQEELDLIEQVAYSQETERLEAQMEFLKRHSGDPEEYELAKSILGIRN